MATQLPSTKDKVELKTELLLHIFNIEINVGSIFYSPCPLHGKTIRTFYWLPEESLTPKHTLVCVEQGTVEIRLTLWIVQKNMQGKERNETQKVMQDQACWCKSIISVLRWLRQEDSEFHDTLGYITRHKTKLIIINIRIFLTWIYTKLKRNWEVKTLLAVNSRNINKET